MILFNKISKYISFKNPIYILISKNSTFKILIFLKQILRKNDIIIKTVRKKNVNELHYYNYLNDDSLTLFNCNYAISCFYFLLVLITRKFYFILYFLKPTLKIHDVNCLKLQENPIVISIDIDNINDIQNIIFSNIETYPNILLILIKNNNKSFFEINSILVSFNFYPYEYNPVTRNLFLNKLPILRNELIYIRDFDLIKERLIKSNKIKIFNFYF